MKTSNLLLLGAAGYGAWYLSQMGVAAGTVNFVFDGVQIKGLTNYEVTLMIQNVSNISLNVNSLTGDIYLNGVSLASLSGFQSVVVPANGQIRIPINVSPDVLSLPMVIKNIINGGGGSLNFKIVGRVNANGLVIPFQVDKTISM